MKKRASTRCQECPKQCFCGRPDELEQNHYGARNHTPWFFLPNCKPDHAQFHRNCERAGVDFRPARDKLFGLIQALKAILVGMWMVVDLMEKHTKNKQEK